MTNILLPATLRRCFLIPSRSAFWIRWNSISAMAWRLPTWKTNHHQKYYANRLGPGKSAKGRIRKFMLKKFLTSLRVWRRHPWRFKMMKARRFGGRIWLGADADVSAWWLSRKAPAPCRLMPNTLWAIGHLPTEVDFSRNFVTGSIVNKSTLVFVISHPEKPRTL